MTPEATAYEKHKNLKLASKEIGINWQTLYYRLKKQGIDIIGDKLRYGSDRDKLAAKAEADYIRATGAMTQTDFLPTQQIKPVAPPKNGYVHKIGDRHS